VPNQKRDAGIGASGDAQAIADRASYPKPTGSSTTGNPGKADWNSRGAETFESIGIDSGEDGHALFPPGQLAGFEPGGKTKNSPNA